MQGVLYTLFNISCCSNLADLLLTSFKEAKLSSVSEFLTAVAFPKLKDLAIIFVDLAGFFSEFKKYFSTIVS
jgi:hypothetical protein